MNCMYIYTCHRTRCLEGSGSCLLFLYHSHWVEEGLQSGIIVIQRSNNSIKPEHFTTSLFYKPTSVHILTCGDYRCIICRRRPVSLYSCQTPSGSSRIQMLLLHTHTHTNTNRLSLGVPPELGHNHRLCICYNIHIIIPPFSFCVCIRAYVRTYVRAVSN